MHLLTATTHSLEAITSAAGSLDWTASWIDLDSTTTEPGSADGNITTATTTSIVAAPGAATQRQVKEITLYNAGTANQTVTVQRDNSAANRVMVNDTLLPGESLTYTDGAGWAKKSPAQGSGFAGRSVSLLKAGTAAEAAGYHYLHHKDSGAPGAWAPGAPGLAGRATDGTTVADAGCLPIPNPATGTNYLTKSVVASTVAHFYSLFDFLWINSGLVVTTTTAQTINSVALPARDANGATSGAGCLIALLVTTATTNAAVISNSTISYTNSAGVAGRTATLLAGTGTNIPATAAIGTLIFFLLQAGDSGVQSIQTCTLGTSLVTGAVSLAIVRVLDQVPSTLANVGQIVQQPMLPGVRLYNGVCALLGYLASTTTATVTHASFYVMER